MNYQKMSKKERIEKIIDALNGAIAEYGYFIIEMQDRCYIYGKKFKIDFVWTEPYIYVLNESGKEYAIIKMKNITQINPGPFYRK